MRRTIDFKFICLSLLMAGTGMIVTACSNEDEDSVKQATRDGSEASDAGIVTDADTVVLDADTLKVFEDYSVKFQLLNSQNLPVTTFKEGENFTFQLTLINSGDDYLSLPISIEDMLYFDIYTNDGTYIGRPYDGVAVFGISTEMIGPRQSVPITCKAFGKRDWDDDIHSIYLALLKTKDREPLPKGEYYTEFTLKFDNYNIVRDSVVFKKEFCIE